MKKNRNEIREAFIFLSEHERAFTENQLILIRGLKKYYTRTKTLTEKQLIILAELQKVPVAPQTEKLNDGESDN